MSSDPGLLNPRALALSEGREIRNYLTLDEMHRLLEACRGHRDHLLVNAAWQTGARISELINVHIRDVDPFHHLITIRTFKKRKGRVKQAQRVIPVPAALTSEISGYALQVGITGRIFPITRQRAYQVIKRAAIKAGLGERIHPHTLRHSFAVNCLAQGVPITVLKDLLGHASVLTTMVYLRIVRQEAQAFLSQVRF